MRASASRVVIALEPERFSVSFRWLRQADARRAPADPPPASRFIQRAALPHAILLEQRITRGRCCA